MKRALIFGVSGQDGAYLSQLLLARGYEVHGTSRDAELQPFARLQSLGIRDRVQVHSASLFDFRDLLQLISSLAPDEIYNLAGQSSVGLSFSQPMETMESVALGAMRILEVIRYLRLPIRLYNASSSECFGDVPHGSASDESTPFNPKSPYATAKAAAQWATTNYRQAYDLFACSGILFNHESPLRSERFVTMKIVAAAMRIAAGSDERLELGNIAISRDWGYAPEYVEAMWRILQQERPGDYVIATGESHTLEELVAAVFEEVSLDWRQHVDINHALFRPAEIAYNRGDPGKAARVLGWEAHTRFREVIRNLVQSRNEGGVPPLPS
jgi:GDPmannose 4,6-dehydratase